MSDPKCCKNQNVVLFVEGLEGHAQLTNTGPGTWQSHMSGQMSMHMPARMSVHMPLHNRLRRCLYRTCVCIHNHGLDYTRMPATAAYQRFYA